MRERGRIICTEAQARGAPAFRVPRAGNKGTVHVQER